MGSSAANPILAEGVWVRLSSDRIAKRPTGEDTSSTHLIATGWSEKWEMTELFFFPLGGVLFGRSAAPDFGQKRATPTLVWLCGHPGMELKVIWNQRQSELSSFTDDETETRAVKAPCPSSRLLRVAELRSEQGVLVMISLNSSKIRMNREIRQGSYMVGLACCVLFLSCFGLISSTTFTWHLPEPHQLGFSHPTSLVLDFAWVTALPCTCLLERLYSATLLPAVSLAVCRLWSKNTKWNIPEACIS